MMVVYILNKSDYIGATYLYQLFLRHPGVEVFVVHNGTDRIYDTIPHEAVITTEDGYTASLLTACRHYARQRDYSDVAAFICSDVSIAGTAEQFIDACMANMDNKSLSVGAWSPSVVEQAWWHMLHVEGSGSQPVIFIEGICFAVQRGVVLSFLSEMDKLTDAGIVNKWGWGVDMFMSWLVKEHGLIGVVDHTIKIHHPSGSAYDTGEAEQELNRWIQKLPAGFMSYYNVLRGKIDI